MKRKNRRVALFVGVDEYKDPSIHPLAGAVADARAIRSFFEERNGQFDETRLLENPTGGQILDALDDLTGDLDKGDFLLFFFAGHGVNEGASQKLLCNDTRRRGSILNFAFDMNNVDQPRPWHVAAILDACRTDLNVSRGGSALRPGSQRDLDYFDSVVANRRAEGASSGSISILYSCDKGMTAGEVSFPDGSSHGLFTQSLLDVLREADRTHRGWNFDQNLRDAIGERMTALAERFSGARANQRPWIQASGGAPLFFMPSVDLDPLRDWIRDFRKGNGITPREETECLRAINGETTGPGAKGIFVAVRFFSDWNHERDVRGEFPYDVASTVLSELCAAVSMRASRDPENVSRNGVPRDTPAASARRLSAGESQRLRSVADAVTPEWRRNPEIGPLLDSLRQVRTEPEALTALRAFEDLVRDEFLGANDGSVAGRGLRRLQPLFLSEAWTGPRRDLLESETPSKTDQALLVLFRVAGTCCIRR